MTSSSAAQLDSTLCDKVEHLSRPDSYDTHPEHVEVIETHMSWVFLTDTHAWKLKKPVRSQFVDLRTVDARRENCVREVSLNRRLADGVYLDIVPLALSSAGQYRLNGEGSIVDWLVKMRRLPADLCLESRIVSNKLTPSEIAPAASRLTHFFATAPHITIDIERQLQQWQKSIAANDRELRDPQFGTELPQLASVTRAQFDFLSTHSAIWRDRITSGRIIDGHGDLRPEHIWLTDPPVIIDCLEFSLELRTMDPVSELAFLALECDRLQAPWVGQQFLDTYSQTTGDVPDGSLLGFYRKWHACTRARLALWHLKDGHDDARKWQQKAITYLELADGPTQ